MDHTPPSDHAMNGVDNAIPALNDTIKSDNEPEKELEHLPPVVNERSDEPQMAPNESTTLYITVLKASLPDNITESYIKVTNEISGEESKTNAVATNTPEWNNNFVFNVFDWVNTFFNIEVYETSMHPEIKAATLQLALANCKIADQGKLFVTHNLFNATNQNEVIGTVELSLSKYLQLEEKEGEGEAPQDDIKPKIVYKKPIIPQQNTLINIIPGTTMGTPPVAIKLPEFEPNLFVAVVQRFSSPNEVICKKMDSTKQQRHRLTLSPDRQYITLRNLETRLRRKRTEANIPITSIKKLVIGDNDNFNVTVKRKKHKVTHSNIFTLHYEENQKAKRVDFIMKNQEEFSAYLTLFSYMIRLVNLDYDSDMGTIELFKIWLKADQNNDGELDVHEVETVLRELQLKIEPHQLRDLFDQFDADKSGVLEFNEFVAFYNMLREVPFIEKLFKSYAVTNKYVLNTHEFKKFIKEVQGVEQVNDAQIVQMMEFLGCQKNENDKIIGLSKPQFYKYMVTSTNGLAPNHVITQDMDQPLTHYTIFSSHHTYLEHHQLKGVASIAQYERYLHEGVRYLEIDCWSGISSPMVTHGRTLTTKIPFLPTLEAIKSEAFSSSEYPLILSFSFNDCTDSEMFFIATKLGSVLGQQNIFYPEVENANELPPFPSPEELKGKYILILNRRYSPKHNDHLHRIFGHMEPFVEYLDEDECFASIEANPAEIARDCQKKLVIVSPKITRFTSTNYPILKPLYYGFSNISLNLQTKDKETTMARTLFASQGGSGYLLKPEVPPSGAVVHTLELTLISGYALPGASTTKDSPSDQDVLKNDFIDPYVEFKIEGMLSKAVSSTVVHDNGFKPYWNQTLRLPLTSKVYDMLTVNIYDSNEGDDELLLSKSMPINSVREGIRAIEFNETSKLFVKCKLLIGDQTIQE